MTASPDTLRALDLFSGIGGFSLGLEQTGAFKPVGFCEVDPFCNEVLKARWPDVPNETRGIVALNALLRRARTSLRRAFPVRTSRSPAEAPDLPAPVRDSSGRFYEPFAWYDRSSRSWRTWQRCLEEGWQSFSGTWPRSGMTRSGIAFQRAPLAPITGATAPGSFLPTPEATKARALRSQGRSPRDFLAPLPTPSVCGNYNRKGASATSGDGLATWVKQWPTPTCPRQNDSDNTAGRYYPSKNQFDLAAAVHFYPTPAASDFKGAVGLASVQRRAAESSRGVRLPEHIAREFGENVGGSLNPDWVEWLMGYPVGWTDPRQTCSREALTWACEPDIPRTAEKVANRVGRLKGCGNAVAPKIPKIIGEAIAHALTQGERRAA